MRADTAAWLILAILACLLAFNLFIR